MYLYRRMKVMPGLIVFATGCLSLTAQTPSFEVASIKPNRSNDRLDYRTEPASGRFMVRNMLANFQTYRR